VESALVPAAPRWWETNSGIDAPMERIDEKPSLARPQALLRLAHPAVSFAAASDLPGLRAPTEAELAGAAPRNALATRVDVVSPGFARGRSSPRGASSF